MTSAVNLDHDAITQAGLVDAEHKGILVNPARGSMDVRKASVTRHSLGGVSVEEYEYEGKPSDEDMRTLRRVSGPIKWSMWTIAFVELCERFSYYGTSVLYKLRQPPAAPRLVHRRAPPPRRPARRPGHGAQGRPGAQPLQHVLCLPHAPRRVSLSPPPPLSLPPLSGQVGTRTGTSFLG